MYMCSACVCVAAATTQGTRVCVTAAESADSNTTTTTKSEHAACDLDHYHTREAPQTQHPYSHCSHY